MTIPAWLPPHLNASSRVGHKEKWTLVYAYFNGIYESVGKPHDGRPVYTEMRKSDWLEFNETTQATPAEIKYCKVSNSVVLFSVIF